MRTRMVSSVAAAGFVFAALLTVCAAAGAGWNVHPEEFDNGGGYSSYTNSRLGCSIGSSVIPINAGSASYASSSSFIPMLETRSAVAAPDLQASAGGGGGCAAFPGSGGSPLTMLLLALAVFALPRNRDPRSP